MVATVSDVARSAHRGEEWTAYARSLDRLLDEHGVVADPVFMDLDVSRADGSRRPLRTFVLSVGSGTPVLFLNGTPATAAVWVPLLARLRGIRAYVVDRPGHGLTGPYDYRGVPDVRAHAVGFLESVLDELGLERVILAGSSLGGLWSLWLADDRPHRVQGIVLPGLPPGLLTNRLPPVFGLLSVPPLSAALRLLDPPRASSTRRLLAMMGDPPDRLPEVFVESFTLGQRLPNVPGGTVRLIHHVEFPGRLPDGWWFDEAAVGRIRQPTLLIGGREDFLGGIAAARRMADALPDCVLVEAGVGHLPWLQDPDAVAAAVDGFVGTIS